MIGIPCYYIYMKGFGKFVGQCMGMGFFEYNMFNGDVDPKEKPTEFPSREEAEEYLNSWEGGRKGIDVIEGLVGEGRTYTQEEYSEMKIILSDGDVP